MHKIKDGPLGIEKSEGVWNTPSICLINNFEDLDEFGRPLEFVNGGGNRYDGYAPKARGGCCGIVEMEDGILHFLSEDDDHYVSKLKATKEEILQVKKIFKFYSEVIVADIDYQTSSYKLKYPKGIKAVKEGYTKENFTGTIGTRSSDDHNKCILSICKKGNKRPFCSLHVSWLPEVLQMMGKVRSNSGARNRTGQ